MPQQPKIPSYATVGQLLSDIEFVALLHSKQVSVVFVALVESLTATAEVLVLGELARTLLDSHVCSNPFRRVVVRGVAGYGSGSMQRVVLIHSAESSYVSVDFC